MKFIIAPDKYKGSLTGFEFCEAVSEGLHEVLEAPEIVKLPLADGGDGTMEVIEHYLQGAQVQVSVNDPLFRKRTTSYLYDAKVKRAYVEMAEASGLKLLKTSEQKCMHTTSYGTGELIKHALDAGAETIILGIGGSSTNDCGIGMATALGYQFLDAHGNEVVPVGKNMESIVKIETHNAHPKLATTKFQIACDVTNPLYGEQGAAYVYGPQKGATEEEVVLLDRGLMHMATLLNDTFSVAEVQQYEGAGAAGGMGAAALTFLGGTLLSGIELIKDIAGLEAHLKGADWIITGEGMLDNQTLSGKTIQGVLQSAEKMEIPVAAFCGAVAVSLPELSHLKIAYATSILKGVMSLEEALASSYDNLKFSIVNFAKLLKYNK